MVRIDKGAEQALARHSEGHSYDEDGLTVQGGLTPEMVAQNAEDGQQPANCCPRRRARLCMRFKT